MNSGEATSYYFAGSQRVAMRKGSTLSWFVTDHLGSTSLALDASGNEVANSRQKYYPFGETRGTATVPTDRQFTGQRREDPSLGSLYDFNARFFSPVLGRFLSADTIVPDPSNPQSLNRYTYVLNDPLRYTYPTGHWEDCGTGPGCDRPLTQQERIDIERRQREANGIPAPQGFALPISSQDAVRIPPLGRYADHRNNQGKHPGADISTPTGTSVHSFADGVVVGVGNQGQNVGFGRYIVVRHIIEGETYYMVYGHLQQQDVRVEDVVLVADQIALSDDTGNMECICSILAQTGWCLFKLVGQYWDGLLMDAGSLRETPRLSI